MATEYRNYAFQSRANRWQDWANLVLAIWLFISPWVLQFGGAQTAGTGNGSSVAMGHAAWNAWVLGVIVFLVALSAIRNIDVRQEWWNMVLGAWIFVAPWALGFVGLSRASWDHWIIGALVVLFAIWSLSRLGNAPATAATQPI